MVFVVSCNDAPKGKRKSSQLNAVLVSVNDQIRMTLTRQRERGNGTQLNGSLREDGLCLTKQYHRKLKVQLQVPNLRAFSFELDRTTFETKSASFEVENKVVIFAIRPLLKALKAIYNTTNIRFKSYKPR
jgi:hypothetical protein